MRIVYLVQLAFLFFLLPQVSAAQDSSDRASGSKGEIYVVNWAPGQTNGPVLRKTTLNYEYWLSGTDLAQKFRFYYELSDIILIDGVAHKRSEIGDELYEDLKIESISFKAKVYQGDQYEGDIVISYPDIAAYSGGESGWYVIKGVNWDEVFVGMSARKAKDIFQGGFELKETEIVGISYHGMEAVEEQFTAQKIVVVEPAKEENTESISGNTSVGSAAMYEYDSDAGLKRKKAFKESGFAGFILDLDKNNTAKATIVPWRINVDLGVSYLRYPIVINSQTQTVSQTGTSIVTESFDGSGGGFLLNGKGAYWPLYGRRLGIGLKSGFTIGGKPKLYDRSYSYFSWHYGVSLYTGPKEQKVKLLLEYQFKSNYGIYFGRSESRKEEGEVYYAALGIAEFNAVSFKMGTKVWISSPSFRTLDLLVRFDKMILPGVSSYYVIAYEARLWNPQIYSVDLVVSPSHPIMGQTLYLNPDIPNGGLMVQLKLSMTLDYFARPHFVKLNSGKRIWK